MRDFMNKFLIKLIKKMLKNFIILHKIKILIF
jgi:hypothetical protein